MVEQCIQIAEGEGGLAGAGAAGDDEERAASSAESRVGLGGVGLGRGSGEEMGGEALFVLVELFEVESVVGGEDERLEGFVIGEAGDGALLAGGLPLDQAGPGAGKGRDVERWLAKVEEGVALAGGEAGEGGGEQYPVVGFSPFVLQVGDEGAVGGGEGGVEQGGEAVVEGVNRRSGGGGFRRGRRAVRG